MITTSPHPTVPAESQAAPGAQDTPSQPLPLAEEVWPPFTPLRLPTTARYPGWMGVPQTREEQPSSASKAKDLVSIRAEYLLSINNECQTCWPVSEWPHLLPKFTPEIEARIKAEEKRFFNEDWDVASPGLRECVLMYWLRPKTWRDYLENNHKWYIEVLHHAEGVGGLSSLALPSGKCMGHTRRDLLGERIGPGWVNAAERLFYRGYPGDLSQLSDTFCGFTDW